MFKRLIISSDQALKFLEEIILLETLSRREFGRHCQVICGKHQGQKGPLPSSLFEKIRGKMRCRVPANWGQARRAKREEHAVGWRGLVSTPEDPSGSRGLDTAENQKGCPRTSQDTR